MGSGSQVHVGTMQATDLTEGIEAFQTPKYTPRHYSYGFENALDEHQGPKTKARTPGSPKRWWQEVEELWEMVAVGYLKFCLETRFGVLATCHFRT